MPKKSVVEIRAFRAVNNHALDHDSLPSRIKILDWGKNEVNDGSIVVLDDKSVRCFDANQRRMGREQVPLDYNHVTVPGTEAYRNFGGNPTIYAYGAPKIIPNDGLYLDAVTWTPTGVGKAKDFIDLSPAPVLENGRVIGLHSCALTPAGAIADLKFYSADSLDGVIKALEADYQPNAYKGQERMDSLEAHNEELMGYFRKKLNLGEGTKAEDIMEFIRAKWEGEEDGEFNMNDLLRKTPGGSVDPHKRDHKMPMNTPHGTITYAAVLDKLNEDLSAGVAAMIKPLTDKIATFEAKAVADTTAAEAAERTQLVAEASRLGKVIPLSADAVKTIPIAALKEMVAQLPKVVPTKLRAINPLNADEKTAAIKGARENASQKLTGMFDRALSNEIPVIPNVN